MNTTLPGWLVLSAALVAYIGMLLWLVVEGVKRHHRQHVRARLCEKTWADINQKNRLLHQSLPHPIKRWRD